MLPGPAHRAETARYWFYLCAIPALSAPPESLLKPKASSDSQGFMSSLPKARAKPEAGTVSIPHRFSAPSKGGHRSPSAFPLRRRMVTFLTQRECEVGISGA